MCQDDITQVLIDYDDSHLCFFRPSSLTYKLLLYNIHFYLYSMMHIADRFNDSTVVSYHIRSSTQIQPSVIIEVKDGDYKRLRSAGQVDTIRTGYIIGYRGCASNPSQVCYIFHNDVRIYIIQTQSCC